MWFVIASIVAFPVTAGLAIGVLQRRRARKERALAFRRKEKIQL